MAPEAKDLKSPNSASGPSQMREVIGFWGTKMKVTDEEREIITIGQDGCVPKGQVKKKSVKEGGKGGQKRTSVSEAIAGSAGGKKTAATSGAIPKTTGGPANTWNDQLLRKLVQNGKWKKTAWLPGSGRHIDEGRDAYEPFTHIVRTLHIEDAVQVMATNRMKPKPLVTFSSLQPVLLPKDHPCKNLKVLWFSARFATEKEEDPNWYGNVEFAIPCHILSEMFKYCFLVEMLTTPTHTVSRVLMTNKDYSSVLRPYNREQPGGGWMVKQNGHFALGKCSRYRFQGTNMFAHVLEFMLEVTANDEKKILSSCEISFKNHEQAKDTRQAHVCNRYQRLKQKCPTPYTSAESATAFRSGLEKVNVDWSKIQPKLTEHAKQFLQEKKGDNCPETAA